MAQHKGFSCPACGAEFETREQLEGHNRTAHQHGGQSGSQPSSSKSDASTGGDRSSGGSGSQH